MLVCYDEAKDFYFYILKVDWIYFEDGSRDVQILGVGETELERKIFNILFNHNLINTYYEKGKVWVNDYYAYPGDFIMCGATGKEPGNFNNPFVVSELVLRNVYGDDLADRFSKIVPKQPEGVYICKEDFRFPISNGVISKRGDVSTGEIRRGDVLKEGENFIFKEDTDSIILFPIQITLSRDMFDTFFRKPEEVGK